MGSLIIENWNQITECLKKGWKPPRMGPGYRIDTGLKPRIGAPALYGTG